MTIPSSLPDIPDDSRLFEIVDGRKFTQRMDLR